MSTIHHGVALLLGGALLAPPTLADPTGMDALWPNADGRSWTYAQHYEDLESTNPSTIDNHTRLFFDGAADAAGGIQAQYLHQELLGPPPAPTALAAAISDPFLRQLWVARPDLRRKMGERIAASAAACPQAHPPGSYSILLNGELALRKTPDEIAAWRCDLAATRNWLWLVSDLTVGNTFTLQLVPDVANDIFLHGTIAAIEPVTVPAGMYPNSVRVGYVIDYGSSECTDPSGTPTGTFRSETLGYVHYVADVGPVDSYEEFIAYAEISGGCVAPSPVGQTSARASMRLESVLTPTRPRTWGRLKLLYR